MNGGVDSLCQFASDNCAGICPQALDAIVEANKGFARSYGDDEYTRKASDALRELFETDCEVFFVFNGTAANALTLSSMCRSYHSIICHEMAHIETDECGAPEFFSNGTKLLIVPGANGKVDINEVRRLVRRRHDIHYPRPHVLSLTQATEAGTVYTLDELSVIGDIARSEKLYLHMDGARFANALVSLGCSAAEMTWKCGIDALCLGGTKNGMAVGEAVIFFNHELAREFDFHCKQGGQLASKMRFITAPWVRMLFDGTWMNNARKANASAIRLHDAFSKIPEIKRMYPCEANALFVTMPEYITERLKQKGWLFHNFIGTGYYRFMCSWATEDKDVERLVRDLKESV